LGSQSGSHGTWVILPGLMTEESTPADLVELVRARIDAANRGDVDSMMRFYAPEAVLEMRHVGGVLSGRAAIRGFIEEWFGGYDELRWQVEELLDLGSGVVLEVVYQRARPVGVAGYVEQREGWVVVLEEGFEVKCSIYQDIDEARAAAERLAQERADG